MELTLGLFGDWRLQKGGPFSGAAFLRLGLARFGCAGSAATVLARCGGWRDIGAGGCLFLAAQLRPQGRTA